jgi:hypothetical protein
MRSDYLNYFPESSSRAYVGVSLGPGQKNLHLASSATPFSGYDQGLLMSPFQIDQTDMMCLMY